MTQKKIIFIVVSLLLVITGWYVCKFVSFKSDKVWLPLALKNAPIEVVDTLHKQWASKKGDIFTILDPSYKGQVSYDYISNHFLLFSYDMFTIKYKDKAVTIKKEAFFPPYIIYKDTMYSSNAFVNNKDSISGLLYIDLLQ